ncbi:MAG TPA: hypothetical protein DDW52_21105 [Planctomycetaceae bacterium]|nr:hypothetical protein [Planctomycetaceae bacterium]
MKWPTSGPAHQATVYIFEAETPLKINFFAPNRLVTHMQRYLLATTLFMVLANVVSGQHRILEIQTPGRTLTGLPIHWGDSEAVLLQSTGAMEFVPQSEIRTHRKTREVYRPQSLAESRAELANQLGTQYETLVSGPYVIAAPRGRAKQWKERFDRLVAGYFRYYQVRDWQLQKPDFPLQVIVFRSQAEFRAFSSTKGNPTSTSIAGSYFPKSNVCALFEMTDPRYPPDETEATVVHEAVHQLAFNTRIHERLFENPLWSVEGLATMFEVREVYDLQVASSTLESRIHSRQVEVLTKFARNGGDLTNLLGHLITDDRAFQRSPELAYAASWALTFYLAERMPRQYRELMQRMRDRRFGAYPAVARIRDFNSATSTDLAVLAREIARLLQLP